MGFGSFFTRAIDTITPWDRQGEVERRKKREEEQQQRQTINQPRQQFNTPSTRQPNNPITDIINQREKKPINIGLEPQNQVNVPQKSEYDNVLPKPKQSFWNKVRDQFDANTEADQYRRLRGNLIKGEDKPVILENPGNIISKTPIVGGSVKMANTLINQSREIPATIRQSVATQTNNPEAFRNASDKLKDIKAGYQKNKGGLFNVGTLYDEGASKRGDFKTGLKDIVAPTAITMADVYTLGKGNLINEAIAKQGLRAGLRSELPNVVKAGIGNYVSGDLGVRSEGGTNEQAIKSGALSSILGLAPDIALPAIAKGLRNRVIPSITRGRIPAKEIANELDDAAIATSVDALERELRAGILSDVDIEDILKGEKIPVKEATSIPVEQPPTIGERVNVRDVSEPKPVIREVEGDAAKRARDVYDRTGVAISRTGEPYKSISGEMLANKEVYDPISGNWLTVDGVGSLSDMNKRIANDNETNILSALIKKYEPQRVEGKSLGEIFSPEDKQLTDLFNQAHAEGKAPSTPPKIKVPEDIPVVDKTEVPQGLPEQPGTVRATTKTDVQAAKTAQAAEEPPVVPRNAKGGQLVPDDKPSADVSYKVNESGQAVPVEGEISPARRDLIFQLGEANKQSVKDARALSSARGERAAKAAGMAEGLEGEAATIARRRGFKGELGHRGKYVGIGGEDGQRIFDELRLEAQRHPELSKRIYDLDNVEVALSRATRGTDLNNNYVGAPTKGQIELLRKYFGDDVAEAVDEAVNISKGLWDKTKEGVGDVVATPRAIMSSMDLSATIRQGGVLSSRFPKEAAQAAKEQLRYFGSADSFKEGMEEIANRASYEKMVKSGLDVTGTQFGKSEEQFIGNLAERIPGLGRGVKASERAYTGFLTKLRADVFDNITDSYAKQGIELSQRELDDLSKFINTASGRGSLGSLEDHAKTLSTTLFSPRLWKSRLDMLNPVYYAKLSGPARKYALQSAGSFASIAGTVLGLAALAGANVETDLRSSDFGKIKVGNHRFDILGGFQQNLVFAHREFTGEKKSSTTGEVTKFARGIPDLIKGRSDEEAGVQTGPYVPNRVSVGTDLLSNKANPVLGAAARLLQGKDRGGNPVNPLEELATLAVPLNVSGTFDTVRDIGDVKSPKDWAKAAAINAPSVFGVSAQTYGEVPSKDAKYDEYASAKDRATKLRDSGALTKPADITKALDNKDYDSVIKGYEYQKALAESRPKTTAKELSNLNNKIKEATYLRDGVPKTDDGVLAKLENGEYDKAIQGLNWKIERAEADGEMSSKSRESIELDIRRAEMYKDGKVSYKDAQEYKNVTLSEWRKMGIPPGHKGHDEDLYNPDLYQKLWEIDEAMAKNNASYAKGDPSKQKYSAKKSGSGRGRGGSRLTKLSADFGRLTGSSPFAPKIREYQTMEQATNKIPVIRRVQPNIVHTIKSGRV